jgi:hypothetical protein
MKSELIAYQENKSLAKWATQWYEADSIAKDGIAKADASLLIHGKWSSQEIRWSTPATGSVSWYVKSGEQAQFTPFSQQQIEALQEIFEYISLATGLAFKKADQGLGDINFGFGNITSGGYASFPSQGRSSELRLQDSASVNGYFTSYGYSSLLHEIGHALGLEHPHEAGVGAKTDTAEASIMSYNQYSIDGRFGTTFMPTDIYALQKMYGQPSSMPSKINYRFQNSGSDFNGLVTSADNILIDIRTPSYIFTGNGTVDIDLSTVSESSFIDLTGRKLGSRLASQARQTDRRGADSEPTETVYRDLSGAWKDTFEDDVASCLINPHVNIGTVWGSTSSDLIKGDATDNTIYALSGSDTIKRTAGSDFYDGGTSELGTGDKLIIEDSITSYRIKRESISPAGSIFSLTSKVDGSKSRCTNIEIYAFSDSTLDLAGAFDQVTGLNTADAQMFRLYNAAFARIPDAAGLRYWISEYTRGLSSYQGIAQSFLNSNEFRAKYGSTNTNEEFAKTLYSNILGRAPDGSGLSYWVSSLNSGRDTRVGALCGFSESAENKNIFSELTGIL